MMRTSRWSWICLLVLGCGGASSDPPARIAAGDGAGADAVATYAGGSVSMAEIEDAFPQARTPACIAARRAPGGGSFEELLPCYREVAENLVLERLALAEVDDVASAVRALESYPELRRHAYLEVFNRRRTEDPEIEIADSAIEAHYQANRELYRRPGSFDLSNIFRRHRDPSKPEESIEFLRRLKERYEAGETFAALAREHSDSETRLRGGQVGRVSEGQLPARLEEVAFALGDGDVSDPVVVRGGAVLLHVRSVARGVDLTLDDVRARIRRELRAEALAERLEQQIAAVEPPQDAVLLEPGELLAALDGGDDEAMVLDVDGDRMTVGEARALAGLAEGARTESLAEADRERLLSVYEQRRRRALLVFDLLRNAEPDFRAEAEEHLEEAAAAALVDELFRREMESSTLVDDEALETYYRDNLPHYQSALRFRLHVWTVPFDADPPRQLERMEELRQALTAGEITLSDAASQLGGAVSDIGWRESDELLELTSKARQYLLQTEAGGFSIPYQDDGALHLIWLEEREEPRPLTYEEAAERVRADYVKRFEEQLFRRLAEERLAAAGFLFNDEAVRRALVG